MASRTINPLTPAAHNACSGIGYAIKNIRADIYGYPFCAGHRVMAIIIQGQGYPIIGRRKPPFFLSGHQPDRDFWRMRSRGVMRPEGVDPPLHLASIDCVSLDEAENVDARKIQAQRDPPNIKYRLSIQSSRPMSLRTATNLRSNQPRRKIREIGRFRPIDLLWLQNGGFRSASG
jgi:hypothetical protein